MRRRRRRAARARTPRLDIFFALFVSIYGLGLLKNSIRTRLLYVITGPGAGAELRKNSRILCRKEIGHFYGAMANSN